MSPYQNRPSRSFWKSGVADNSRPVPSDLHHPKFAITRDMRIATAGSCFAQHLGRNLAQRGFGVIDMEPAPGGLAPASAQQFGYGIYSARYGNIYTVRQLLQLLRECTGRFTPAHPVWERDGRFFDAQRPSVEPNGLATAEMVAVHRAHHLKQVRRMFRTAELLVLTLGLTEVWEDIETGTVYPTAPGTLAGKHDPERFRFRNLTYAEIREDLETFLRMVRRGNPGLKLLVTVSPVPLTATATDDHVLVATTYSKAVLRAVAGDVARDAAQVDYFPSFEIITGAPAGYRFFEPNLRSVAADGVAAVMATFFDAYGEQPAAETPPAPAPEPKAKRPARRQADDDVVCEDALLEAFAR